MNSGAITVRDSGLFATIQDLGRTGWCATGLPPGGAADALSLRIGNRLVGNADDAAGVEMTLVGGEFEFHFAALAAVVGAECDVTHIHGDEPAISKVATITTISVVPGDRIRVGRFSRGTRAYLCVPGGIDVPCILGSRSTYTPAVIGGHDGRALRRGDVLQIRDAVSAAPRVATRELRSFIDNSLPTSRLRVTRGPHIPHVGLAVFEQLLSAEWVIDDRSNRAGVRLAGIRLDTLGDGRLTSEAMPYGAIQLPPGGAPIILGVDRPTTGGYPIVACVIAADWRLIGQLRPRERVRFAEISLDDARRAAFDEQANLNMICPPNAGTAIADNGPDE